MHFFLWHQRNRRHANIRSDSGPKTTNLDCVIKIASDTTVCALEFRLFLS